jgi:hypothetical protein
MAQEQFTAEIQFTSLECDYLVVGAGAAGMVFVDTILTENPAVNVVLVDRYSKPGGHWTIAYDFVKLHQPAAYYGVNSTVLCGDKPSSHLATKSEILEHFETVLQRWLSTGRLRYLPSSDHKGGGRVVPMASASGPSYVVHARMKTVDTTYSAIEVPAMRPPPFHVGDGARALGPGDLPRMHEQAPHDASYVIVGGGKTGIDTVLWLLEQGVPVNNMWWIIPCDTWLYNRAIFQPGRCHKMITTFAKETASATSVGDLYSRLERVGFFLRLDETKQPGRNRCASVSRDELVQLRKLLPRVVRNGYVSAVGDGEVTFGNGEKLQVPSGTLLVDCTANGHPPRPEVPVFQGDTITMQIVSFCQTTLSATLIAHLEAKYPHHEDWKNSLCAPITMPQRPEDIVVGMYKSMKNHQAWQSSPALLIWLFKTRSFELSHGAFWKVLKYRSQVLFAEPRAIKVLESLLETKAAAPEQSGCKVPSRWRLRPCVGLLAGGASSPSVAEKTLIMQTQREL